MTEGAPGSVPGRTPASRADALRRPAEPQLDCLCAVAAGAWSSCALLPSGKVACWGANQFGQLGHGTTTSRPTPVEASGLDDATAIGMGDAHACALRKSGKVSCWGANAAGQLGDGTLENRSRPPEVRGLEGVVRLAVGGHHACALLARGEIMCWGSNLHHQLGRHGEKQSTLPVPTLPVLEIAAPP